MQNVTENGRIWCDMGKRLRECRKMRGLSQEELVEKIELLPENDGKTRNPKQIGYIENGTRKLSVEYAALLAEVLQVNADYLLLKTDYRTHEDEMRDLVNGIESSLDQRAAKRICLAGLIESLGYTIESKYVIFCRETGYFDDQFDTRVANDTPCFILSPNGERAEVRFKDLQQIMYNIISSVEHELSKPFDDLWQILRLR